MNIAELWWLFFFGGILVTFFAFISAGRPPLIGLGLVSVCTGFVMMGIESHRPYTRTWIVDRFSA